MKERTAVILCGGRGKRLGSIGDQMPKTLVNVHGKPILWYIFMRLYAEGFRHFVLPLGYRGHLIQGFIDNSLTDFDMRIDAIPTGEETEVGLRLDRVRHLLPDDSFLLVNGDTLFDFDVAGMADRHDASGADVTLTSCEVVSQFGLLVLQDEKVVGFTRDSIVQGFQVATRPGGAALPARVNAGIALIRKSALDAVDLAKTQNFEIELYQALIARDKARHHPIDGFWFAIDTPKDLDIANSRQHGDSRSEGTLALAAKLSDAFDTLVAARKP